MPALVPHPDRIRLAMLGMVDGNGHPISWSAIINGRFDEGLIRQTPYPVIADYLSTAPADQLGIDGAEVTHIWCDDRADAEHTAKCAAIPHIVDKPEDVIGQVDAVVIPTDKGHEHLDRARPFIEAGLPVFIDKPLTDRLDHLQQFAAWKRAGKPLLSSSCMRYCREFVPLRDRLGELGEMRLVTMTMAKSWERYGIHALEAVYPLLPPGGWQSVQHRGDHDRNLVLLRHDNGADVVIACIKDLYGGFGVLNLHGTTGSLHARFTDNFGAFRDQLASFVTWLQTGREPYPFEETVELMQLVIAGLASRDGAGREVALAELTV